MLSGMALFLNLSNAAELVQFSNGKVADANEINANFNELATRIQNQAATVGVAGPKGDNGAAGPLSSLKCTDGEVAVSSGGDWVCSLSGNGASLPKGNISVQLGGVDQPTWKTWTGGGGTTTAIVSGGSAAELNEVTLYGSFPDGTGGSVSQSNFRVISSALGEWTTGISKVEPGAVVLPTQALSSSFSITQFSTVGYKLEPIVLRSSYRSNSSSGLANSAAYNWWRRGDCSGCDDIKIELLDSSLNAVHLYEFYKCTPVGWGFDGVEEELTLQCLSLRNLDSSTEILGWIDDISLIFETNIPRNLVDWASLNMPRDITVVAGSGKQKLNLNYINSIPTRYAFPVLDMSRTSSAATVAFSFRSNDFNVTDASVTDVAQF